MEEARADREKDLAKRFANPFDLVVIGAGALGSAVCWEAASRGLRVALLEKNDFCSGTSANSLRIIHGGLRYLQTMNLRRARSSAEERTSLLRIAPHLVAPLEFMVPTMHCWKRGRVAWAFGLAMDRLLTLDLNRDLLAERRLPPARLVSQRELTERAFGVNLNGATAGARWFDATMTDPERLGLSFVLSARSLGATVCNHVQAIELLQRNGRVVGVAVCDQISGERYEICAKVVADCRGPWSGSSSTFSSCTECTPTRYVKGVNLILKIPPLKCGVGFPARDQAGRMIAGRLFFATPFRDAMAVGTWYFETKQSPDQLSVSAGELDMMLSEVRRACPGWGMNSAAVGAVHVGLLARDKRSMQPVPTDRPIIQHTAEQGGLQGIWRLETEKWTMARKLAEHAIDRICATTALSSSRSETRWRSLHGGDFRDFRQLTAAMADTRPASVNDQQIVRLISRYGKFALLILASAKENPSLTEPLPASPQIMLAELNYVLEQELPQTLEDLVLRRLSLGSTGPPPAETLAFTADIMGERFGWSANQIRTNIEAVQNYCGYGIAS